MADFVIFRKGSFVRYKSINHYKKFSFSLISFFWVVGRRTVVLLGCIQTYKKITIFYIFFENFIHTIKFRETEILVNVI